MSDHQFRRREGVSAYREFFRTHFPNGSDGWTVEDIDGVLRRFDPKKPGDSGRLILIEEKAPNAPKMSWGQWKTYSQLDSLLRKGDPDRRAYWGFLHLVAEDWERGSWWEANGVRLARDALIGFFHGEVPLRPINFADPEDQQRFTSRAGAHAEELVASGGARCPMCKKPVRGSNSCRCVF